MPCLCHLDTAFVLYNQRTFGQQPFLPPVTVWQHLGGFNMRVEGDLPEYYNYSHNRTNPFVLLLTLIYLRNKEIGSCAYYCFCGVCFGYLKFKIFSMHFSVYFA